VYHPTEGIHYLSDLLNPNPNSLPTPPPTQTPTFTKLAVLKRFLIKYQNNSSYIKFSLLFRCFTLIFSSFDFYDFLNFSYFVKSNAKILVTFDSLIFAALSEFLKITPFSSHFFIAFLLSTLCFFESTYLVHHHAKISISVQTRKIKAGSTTPQTDSKKCRDAKTSSPRLLSLTSDVS